MNTHPIAALFRRVILPLLLLSVLLGPARAASESANLPPFTAVNVIGDSLSDTGRTSAVLTQVMGSPFPPPPYAAGRMSNGPLWIEYFTPMLGKNYQPRENFSWAGATTGHLNVFGPGLPGMLDELTELLDPPAQRLNKNALYVVFGGANDFVRILNGEDPNVVIPAGIANIIQIVTRLRAAGAENIVVVNLPDIGLIPRALAGGPAVSAGASFLSVVFNTNLNAALDNLGFPVVRVNLFALIHAFVSNPAAYGFTNVTSPGILDLANSGTYLFWDDVHPTTRAHLFVADEVYRTVLTAGLIKHPLQ